MSLLALPQNDERVAAVRTVNLLDTAEDDIYNSIVQAVADVCHTSIAVLGLSAKEPRDVSLSGVHLTKESRRWCKCPAEVSPSLISGNTALCSEAMHGKDALIVPDTLEDRRFQSNPLVTGAPYIRFYAGIPVISPEGLAIGSLCVMDTRSRTLDDQQRTALLTLAHSAGRVLQLRKNIGIAVFARAIDMASDGVTIAGACANGTTIMYANESFRRLTGYSYLDAINQPAFFPVRPDYPGLLSTLAQAAGTGQMTTLDCELSHKNGEARCSRVSFVPYMDGAEKLAYLVTVHHDISLLREAEAHMQQLYAMRTTLATIEHVVRNFLNSAQLYSTFVNSKTQVEEAIQKPFEAALEEARLQIAAMKRMPSFKDKPTPSGSSVLDVDR